MPWWLRPSVWPDFGAATSADPYHERGIAACTELAAYRILQESLTNVVRHADASTVHVSVGYGARELTLEVVDDGSGRGAAGADGSGIAGMRERAIALGGDLSTGRAFSGGFRVRARLPLDGAA